MASCSPVSGLHESTHEVILGIAGEAVKLEQANTGHEKTRPSRTRQKPAHNSLSAEKLDPSRKGAYSIVGGCSGSRCRVGRKRARGFHSADGRNRDKEQMGPGEERGRCWCVSANVLLRCMSYWQQAKPFEQRGLPEKSIC